jgi:hypothetical protein
MATRKTKAAKPAAKKSAAKKSAPKKAAAKKQEYQYHYVEPDKDRSPIRFKLLAIFKKHKKNTAEAIKAAVKAGVNKHTAAKQIYLMANNM